MGKKRKYYKAYDEILNLIEKGTMYNDALAVICGKFQLTERTFINYWNDARIEFVAREALIKQQVDKERVEVEKKIMEVDILTKADRMRLATKLAKGAGLDSDKLRALEYLSKIEGDFVTKIDHTTKGGSLSSVTVQIIE